MVIRVSSELAGIFGPARRGSEQSEKDAAIREGIVTRRETRKLEAGERERKRLELAGIDVAEQISLVKVVIRKTP